MDILLGSQMKDVGCRMVLENALIYLFRKVFPFWPNKRLMIFFPLQFSQVIINEVIFFTLSGSCNISTVSRSASE